MLCSLAWTKAEWASESPLTLGPKSGRLQEAEDFSLVTCSPVKTAHYYINANCSFSIC